LWKGGYINADGSENGNKDKLLLCKSIEDRNTKDKKGNRT
jgi:hypothetical protein